MSLQVVFGAAGVYAIDAVPLTWRLDAFYAFLCGGLLIALFVSARWYPDDPEDRPPAAQIAWRVLAGRGTLVVAGTGLYFLMIGAVWGYLEGIARAAGLSLEQTGTALSGGLVVSLLGSGDGGEPLTVAPSSTSFTFPTAVSFRTAYSVTVMSDPAGLTCSASNASSTVPASNSTNTVGTTTVANIAAACPAR